MSTCTRDECMRAKAAMEGLESEVRMICSLSSIRAIPTILRGNAESHLNRASAVLSVGSRARTGLPWISINARGWIARIATAGGELSADLSGPNPMAALFAASMGVAEVFKRLVGVSSELVPDLGTLSFSLHDFTETDSAIGHELSLPMNIPNTLLVGAGAIGNGVALLAAQLLMRGNLHIVDKQAYGDENAGTCVLMESEGWSGVDKAERLAEWLRANDGPAATGEKAYVADAIGGANCQALAPRLVINGLDDVQARHDAQMVWPECIVDGGIGEFGFAVIQHRLDDRGLACLRCAFQLPVREPNESKQSLTGLDAESLRDPDRVLTQEDVERADPEKKEWLRAKMLERKTICSIASEASLERLGADVGDGFQPSVPFVATAAAAMMMAEVVKAVCFPDRTYHQSLVMGNLLLGSKGIGHYNRRATTSCRCVVHRKLIDGIRARRGGALSAASELDLPSATNGGPAV